MRRSKKAMMWSIAEFWSWIAMFIIILVFMVLFKFCSSPSIERTQGVRLDALKERQAAVDVLRTPVEYGGQNLTIAYLLTLGAVKSEFIKVKPVVESALGSVLSYRQKGYVLQIAYTDRTETIKSDPAFSLDGWIGEVKLPLPTGTPVTVKVGSASEYRYVGEGIPG